MEMVLSPVKNEQYPSEEEEEEEEGPLQEEEEEEGPLEGGGVHSGGFRRG